MNNKVDSDRRTLLQIATLMAVTAPGIIPKSGYAWPVAENKNRTRVRDVEMAWYEVGEGDPIVFIHGNPTSSYQWRNVIPYVEHLGRCIAPDMVGMGDSDSLPDSGPGRYTYLVQRDYMFELFENIGIEDNVIFVVHDWGSAMDSNGLTETRSESGPSPTTNPLSGTRICPGPRRPRGRSQSSVPRRGRTQSWKRIYSLREC